MMLCTSKTSSPHRLSSLTGCWHRPVLSAPETVHLIVMDGTHSNVCHSFTLESWFGFDSSGLTCTVKSLVSVYMNQTWRVWRIYQRDLRCTRRQEFVQNSASAFWCKMDFLKYGCFFFLQQSGQTYPLCNILPFWACFKCQNQAF